MNWNIAEIVNKLLGSYQSCASHSIDMDERLPKLEEVDMLLFLLINNLIQNAKERNSAAYSVAQIGKRSYEILMERLGQIKQVCD